MQVNIYVYGSVANIGTNNGAINMGQNKERIDMKRIDDHIRFDDTAEINDVANALSTFVAEHPESKEKECAIRLIDMLNVMYSNHLRGIWK